MVRSEKIIVRVDAEIQNLIPRFLENRRKALAAMLEALKQGDYETVRVLGHRLKGSAASYGFDALGEMGRQIEQAARERDAEGLREQVDDLAVYLERLEVVYE